MLTRNDERRRIITTDIWFQKYRILNQLGKGGTGEVFLAEHIRLGYFRAIKRIKKSQPAYEQLMQEADILKGLSHPSIPVVYDIEEDAEYSYIVMEYVEGLSLRALYLKQGCIKETEIVYICLQICEVFQLLHSAEQSIFYLDLKPDNVIIKGLKVKLIDFGTAKMESGKRESVSMGTKGFAAPEQYRLNGADRQSDIYGLGSLMLFMATGSPGSKGLALLEEKTYSNPFKQMVFQCLKYNKTERFETIEEVKKGLLALKPGKEESLKPGTSVIAAFAGVQPRCGVTHICLLLTRYLCSHGQRAVYVEVGKKKDIHALYQRGDTIGYPVLCGEPEKLRKKYREYDIFICDYGTCQEESIGFWQADVVCLVTGARPWELRFWEEAEKKVLQKELKGRVYFLVNLVCAREFFELVKSRNVGCLRMPYREQFFKEDRELSGLLARLLKGSFYEEKNKRASKDSLFGWCRTWCRGNSYRYFAGRIFRGKKRGTDTVFRSKQS